MDENFDLQVTSGRRGRFEGRVLQSPGGECGPIPLGSPFDSVEFKGHMDRLRDAVMTSATTRRAAVSREADVRAAGAALFKVLFPEPIRRVYEQSKREALLRKSRLRIRLRCKAPEIAQLPLEYMYDERAGQFLGISAQNPLVRYVELESPPDPLRVRGTLNVLGMIAGPRDMDPIDAPGEREILEEAFRSLSSGNRVNLDWVDGQTSHHLQDRLAQGECHVFHYIGHGGFDDQMGEGYICLADDHGRRRDLTAGKLASLLGDHPSLRLAVLNSCEGARSDGMNPFSSIAAVLARTTIPAVISMHYSISDNAAVEFSRRFYSSIATGSPVDVAVAEGRKALYTNLEDALELGIPVLHMRARDGSLFSMPTRGTARRATVGQSGSTAGRPSDRGQDLGDQAVTGDERALGAAMLPDQDAAARVGTPATIDSPMVSGVKVPDLVDALLGTDPVESRAAAETLTGIGPSTIRVLFRQLQTIPFAAIPWVRFLVARFPEESGPLMAARVAKARDWHRAVAVTPLFGPAHQPRSAGDVAELLDSSDIDVVRLAVESLGYMAAEEWAYRIDRLVADEGDYLYRKYAYYAILARARMLIQNSPRGASGRVHLASAFLGLELRIRDAARRGWHGLVFAKLKSILSGCHSGHADVLMTEWLNADLDELRLLAAEALGYLGMKRTLGYLLPVAERDRSDDVARSAVFAVGRIGGPDAVDALEGLLAGESDVNRVLVIRWAIAMCVADARDDVQFERLARQLIGDRVAEVSWVHRAIGLRGTRGLATILWEGLEDGDSTVRGQSALAIARLRLPGAHKALVVARHEAADAMERVVTTLALLVTGHPPPEDPNLLALRSDLSADSYLYNQMITHDITSVLMASRHPDGARIAAAWQPVYAYAPVEA